MKFTISRANQSEWHEHTDLPHSRAYKGELIEWVSNRDNWQTKEKYTVKESRQIWYIEFSDLDDLIEFVGKNGACVVYPKTDVGLHKRALPIPHIQIYDGYIE